MRAVSMVATAGAAALLLGMVVSIPRATSASASTHRTSSTQFGTISNFDVFNDTGQGTEGFEIELDGITSSDITYTFGAPYERYGNPTITPFAGGVYVIYASPWDPVAKKFTQSTPVAPTPIQPTAGHQCWTGGSATYATAGCEHFGLGLAANPTNVVYQWLVADPAHPGKLMPFGGGVPIPAPQWSTSPPLHPVLNPKPVVNVVAPAPEPDVGQQLGDAVWVKVYMTESTAPSDLNHLVSGDIHVPDAAAEVETDWLLIQGGAGGGLQTELANSDQLAAHSKSVVRKYQFFKYTGPYSSENHEATPVNDSRPSAGERGNLIGNQMAGLNLAAAGKIPGDRVRPIAYFVKKPPLTTTLHSATFRFRATDNVSAMFTYFCSLDKKIPARCTNPKTYSALKKGVHSLSVYAIDKAANPSKALLYRWTVK
ncbi:MAG TPA: hypothetical protein VMU72_06595 [Gaiellaceae bacterium]|nr:hypothetical protein [Gaiellaceae bacterium]